MRKLALTISIFLVLSQDYASYAATAKLGGSCTKLNQVQTVKNVRLICSKSGSKLIWKVSTKPTIKPKSDLKESPSPTSIPTITQLITPINPVSKPAEIIKSSYAFSFMNSAGIPGHWNSCSPITWGFYKNELAVKNLASVITNLQILANATGFTFQYVDIENSPAPTWAEITGDVRNTSGPQIQIIFAGSELDPNFKDVKLGGETIMKRLTEVEWSRAYVILNSSNWANINLPDSDPRGMRHSILHELSHAMGLAHVDYPNQIMNPVAQEKSPNTFGKGDLMGLYLVSAAIPCKL